MRRPRALRRAQRYRPALQIPACVALASCGERSTAANPRVRRPRVPRRAQRRRPALQIPACVALVSCGERSVTAKRRKSPRASPARPTASGASPPAAANPPRASPSCPAASGASPPGAANPRVRRPRVPRRAKRRRKTPQSAQAHPTATFQSFLAVPAGDGPARSASLQNNWRRHPSPERRRNPHKRLPRRFSIPCWAGP